MSFFISKKSVVSMQELNYLVFLYYLKRKMRERCLKNMLRENGIKEMNI